MKINEGVITQLLSAEVKKAIQLKRDAEKSSDHDELMYANGFYDGLYGVFQKILKM